MWKKYSKSKQTKYSEFVKLGVQQPSPFTMPINEMPINMSKTGQKIVAFSLLFFSVI